MIWVGLVGVKLRNEMMNSFLFCFFFINWLAFIPFILSLDPLIDYKNASFPCKSECVSLSSQKCFHTAWEIAAARTRIITKECTYVVYSVSLNPDLNDIHPIPDFWSGDSNNSITKSKPCSIYFIQRRSKFVERTGAESLEVVNNWTLILIDNLPMYESRRKASKIPKLMPDMFFAGSVMAAIYIDAKLSLTVSPSQWIQKALYSHPDTILAAIGHHQLKEIVDEISFIELSNWKKGISSYRDMNANNRDLMNKKLMQQYNDYQENGLFELMETQNISQALIDGGILFHKLHHPQAAILRCAWLEQVHRYSDRDQAAFPFVVGWFNNFLPIEQHQDYSLVPLLFDRQNTYNVMILDTKYHYWKGKEKISSLVKTNNKRPIIK